jgi:hypothetical protein
MSKPKQTTTDPVVASGACSCNVNKRVWEGSRPGCVLPGYSLVLGSD